jgi:diguanylate cyclase (GGDEF)-like protein/PAS domain S-box-containing protein
MLRFSKSVNFKYKSQIKIVFAAAIIPSIFYLLYLFTNIFKNINIISCSFIATGVLSFFALYKYKLFELLPIARCQLLDNMNTGFIFINNIGNVTDLNNIFLDMVSVKREDVLDMPVEKAFHFFPEIVSVLNNIPQETTISLKDQTFFKIKVIDVNNSSDIFIGKLAILTNITDEIFIEQKLKKNDKFRHTLTKLATNFINIPIEKIDTAIDQALSYIGQFLEVDRAYIFYYDNVKRYASNTCEWCAENINSFKAKLQNIPFEEVPTFLLPHLKGELIYCPDTSILPEGSSEKAIMEEEGIKSFITLPMMADNNECIGFIGFDMVKEKKEFNNEEKELLKILVEIFASVERRRIKKIKLKKSEFRYNLFFDNAPLGIVHIDNEGNILKVNQKFVEIMGTSQKDVEKVNIIKEMKDDLMKQCFLDALEGKTGRYENVYTSFLSGKSAYIRAIAKSILDETRIVGAIGIFEDITNIKQKEEQLNYAALHDSLTNLPNRILLLDRIERAISRHKRYPSDYFIFMVLDLDDFKRVNDSLGHDAGDTFLKVIAKKLLECIRPDDTLARLGGDEFAILIEQQPEFELGKNVAERVLSVIEEPVQLGEHFIASTASIGICQYSPEFTTPEEYLRNADIAMYKAKQQGKNRCAYFSQAMHEIAIKKLTEETFLWEAVKNNEFSTYYQPIVETQSEKIIGYEVLLRWNHPVKGLLLPGTFIPLAEETGLIVNIGEWVIRNVCQQKWILKNITKKPFNLHLNISTKQLQSQDFLTKVKNILEETGFPPEYLYFEITESVLMVKEMTDVLLQLKTLGIKIVIDDFGTGFSSLSYLHRYPIDGIKIDKSFISGMLSNTKDREIVRTIIAMGKTLQMPVTAEGVETKEQADYLKQLACEFAQGFLWGTPVEKINTE